MTRVWLLRHAESANPKVFHGAESDIDLSPRGYLQAEALAEALADCQPEVIISSAMLRARMTAQPLAQRCALHLQIEPELHERRVGPLSGQPFDHLDGLWQKTVRRWLAGDTQFAPLGAESFDEIQTRILPVWHRVTEQHQGRRLVMVAHGIICKVLLLSLLPRWSVVDWDKLGPIPNVAISELVQIESAWHANRLNEHPKLLRDRGLV